MNPEYSVMKKMIERILINRIGMKHLVKSIAFASVALIAAVGCQNKSLSVENAKRVHFVLHADTPDTKTGVMYEAGTYVPYWNKGDSLGVIFTLPTKKADLKADAVFTNTEETGSAASFEGDVTLEDGEGITFYSFYPASSVAKSYYDSNTEIVTIGLDIPSDQSPAYDESFGYSYDPKADILIAKPATCAVVDATAFNEVDMYFARLSSVLRIELNAETSAKCYGEVIKSFKIETSKGDIAGRIAVNPLTGEYSKTNQTGTSKVITATYDTVNGPVSIGKEGENNVFLGVAPVTIEKGSTLTITAETVTASGAEGHSLVKTITTTSDIVFESSKPTVLKLTLSDENVVEAYTISKITGAGTYKVTDVTVMAVYGQNIIVSDNTGSILVYAAKNHGYIVGDILDINGSVKEYNQILEFDSPTISKTGTNTITYPEPVEYNAEKIADYAVNSVIEYGHALGLADKTARTVTLNGQVLNVYGDLSSVDGKGVDIYGYAFGYSNSKVNFLYTSVVENESYPVLSTTPANGETLSWKADEYGEENAKTVSVSLNGAASGYTVSEADSNWNVTDDGNGTVTVYPVAANTGTSEADIKTLNLVITHKDDASLISTITLKQAQSGAKEAYFVKVESTPSDWSGTYLIVYESESGNVAFDGSLSNLDATNNTKSVTIADKKIVATDDLLKSVFTIDSKGKTIKSSSGYYIGRDASSNGLNSSQTQQYTNTLSITTDGNFEVKGSGGAYLKYNSADNQKRFRYFKSGQQAIQLYKYTE